MSKDVIAAVRNEIAVPLIVGGGIKSHSEMRAAYEAGADMVVVGNALEDNPEKLAEFLFYD